MVFRVPMTQSCDSGWFWLSVCLVWTGRFNSKYLNISGPPNYRHSSSSSSSAVGHAHCGKDGQNATAERTSYNGEHRGWKCPIPGVSANRISLLCVQWSACVHHPTRVCFIFHFDGFPFALQAMLCDDCMVFMSKRNTLCSFALNTTGACTHAVLCSIERYLILS